jgi:CRP-like cAMP-binding protein
MSKIDVLRRISLFAGLNDETLIELAASLGKRTFGADMILFHKGSPSQSLYLIESGKVRLCAATKARSHPRHLRSR